jgi:hypothetical protein
MQVPLIIEALFFCLQRVVLNLNHLDLDIVLDFDIRISSLCEIRFTLHEIRAMRYALRNVTYEIISELCKTKPISNVQESTTFTKDFFPSYAPAGSSQNNPVP